MTHRYFVFHFLEVLDLCAPPKKHLSCSDTKIISTSRHYKLEIEPQVRIERQHSAWLLGIHSFFYAALIELARS